MKTVVTGGAGFIGSNLVRKLLDQEREVIIADDFSRGSTQNLADLKIKPGDVGNKSEFTKIDLKDYQQAKNITMETDSVFHLAARIGSINFLHGNNYNELEALQSNLTIDANVFKACLENGVKTRFCFQYFGLSHRSSGKFVPSGYAGVGTEPIQSRRRLRLG